MIYSVFYCLLKNKGSIAFAFLVVSIAVFGLYWLAFGILMLFVFYKISTLLCNRIKDRVFRAITRNIFTLLLVFILSVGAKIFLVEIYKIPSNSMQATLLTGDVILVNKLLYGPILPNSVLEISWINFLFGNSRQDKGIERKEHHIRAKGLTNIKQGDVLVYRLSKNYFAVKRCVGVAGDLLEIRDGEVYTNNQRYYSPKLIKNHYQVTVLSRNSFEKYIDMLSKGNNLLNYYTDSNLLFANLTIKEANILMRDHAVKLSLSIVDSNKDKLFPLSQNQNWTLDNMGPFRIPYKGMKINLSVYNYSIYAKAIGIFENKKISLVGNRCYIDGFPVLEYTFKEDYFFLMGDDRKNSMDSRYIGFIPKEDIIGKSPLILYSNNNGHFWWNRIIKSIR